MHAGIQTSPDEVVCCCDCCRYSVAEGTVYVPIRLFRQILVLAPRCSQAGALLHSSQPTSHLQPTSDRRLIFASHLATGMIPVIAIISDLLCLQGTRGSSKYFLINALLSFCRNNFCRPRAICRVIHIVLLCPSSKTRFQECSVINPSVLLTFTML